LARDAVDQAAGPGPDRLLPGRSARDVLPHRRCGGAIDSSAQPDAVVSESIGVPRCQVRWDVLTARGLHLHHFDELTRTLSWRDNHNFHCARTERRRAIVNLRPQFAGNVHGEQHMLGEIVISFTAEGVGPTCLSVGVCLFMLAAHRGFPCGHQRVHPPSDIVAHGGSPVALCTGPEPVRSGDKAWRVGAALWAGTSL